MSYFAGVTFADQSVTPEDDAIAAGHLYGDGILKNCPFSYSGSTLTMGGGQLMICGRNIRHTAAENWAVVDAASGYARLVLVIDMTQASSQNLFEQVRTEIQYAATVAGFPELTQEDINERGSVYQAVLCVVSLGTGGITGIVSTMKTAASGTLEKLGGVSMATASVVLELAGWSNKSQTVSVDGVTANNVVIPAPAPGSHVAYYKANVRCTAQADGALTFVCDTVPTAALTVNVLVLTGGVSA